MFKCKSKLLAICEQLSNDHTDCCIIGSMTDPFENQKPYQELPAADIKASGESHPLTMWGFPVVIPDEDANDKVVPIRGKDLKRWRGKLLKICSASFRCDDFLLAISMLLIGAWLTVLLIPNTSYQGFTAFALNTLLPVLGVACLVAFFFLRRAASESPKGISKELLDEIPNPESMNVAGDKDEPK